MHKVLLATMSLGIGGAETHIVELALELKRRGVSVIAASNGGVYADTLVAAGIPHYTVPMHRRRLTDMLKSYFMMRRLIRTEKPDVVHAHARIPGFICGLLSKSMSFAFVTTAHGVFDVSRGLRYLTNWGRKTLAVSDDIRQYLIDNYALAPDDIFLTINSVDTEKFSPSTSADGVIDELALDTGRPIVCSVSRFDSHAAEIPRMLVELAPELGLLLPGLQLLIVGSDESDAYDELKAKADEINAAAGARSVILTGARTDVNSLLAACHLFVGVSRAALEAMASGKPVIAAGSKGYGQGFAGLLTTGLHKPAMETNFTFRGFPETTPALLRDEIVAYFTGTTDDERADIIRSGRELVIKSYSVGRMVDDCIRAYVAAGAADVTTANAQPGTPARYNVVMSGYYGYKNAGDEAILQSIHRSIKNACDDVSITVLSSDPEDTRLRYGYDAIARFNILKVYKALKNCDVLISGGGSLLQDFTSTRSLLYYLFIINTAWRLGKKVMIYANGIGPVSKAANRRRVRHATDHVDIITLRDAESVQELRSMGVTRGDLLLTADPVFTMRRAPLDDTSKLLQSHGIPHGPFITVSIRDWSGAGDFYGSIASICDSVYETGRSVVFIPMHSGKDAETSRKVRSMMQNPSCLLEERLTAEELMDIIGASDMMLAMRLHALIFAACMNVPFAGLVYDPKVAAYAQALGMPEAGNVTSFDREHARSVVLELLEHRETYIPELKLKSAALEEAAKQDPALLLTLLGK